MQESAKGADSFDAQPLATLVDLELPGCDALKVRLTARVEQFAELWLRKDAFTTGSFTNLFFEQQVDNFGIFGTALLISKIGVHRPAEDFEARAVEHIERVNTASFREESRTRRFFFKERVFCYCETEMLYPTATALPGELLRICFLKENSFQGEGTRAGRTGLLRSSALPINDLVDRTLCAEYQALSEICDLLDAKGVNGSQARCFVSGTVKLWTTGASCLSCVGIMRQFAQLYPSVALEVVMAKRLAA